MGELDERVLSSQILNHMHLAGRGKALLSELQRLRNKIEGSIKDFASFFLKAKQLLVWCPYDFTDYHLGQNMHPYHLPSLPIKEGPITFTYIKNSLKTTPNTWSVKLFLLIGF